MPQSERVSLARRWRDALMSQLQTFEVATPLKEAALSAKMADWTRYLTAVVVKTCQPLGWIAAAKGHALEVLPQAGQEFLGMDVMAFEQHADAETRRWRFPAAVFELENSRSNDRVAYSLWKVLCMRCSLRAVIAYRRNWDQAADLVRRLSADVVGRIPPMERTGLDGSTLVVTGSRSEAETFPWGYFKVWELNTNLGRFEKI